jgi:hypothetical protein
MALIQVNSVLQLKCTFQYIVCAIPSNAAIDDELKQPWTLVNRDLTLLAYKEVPPRWCSASMRNNVMELTKRSFLPPGSKYCLPVLRSKDLFKLSNGRCAKVVVLIRIVSSTANFRYTISIYAIKNSLADKVYNVSGVA